MAKFRLGSSLGAISSLGFKDGKYNYAVKKDLKDKLIRARELGFDTVDVDLCSTYNPFDLEQILDEILFLVKSSGVKVNAFHMPFGVSWMDLTCNYENDRQEIIKWILKVIDKTSVVDPYAFVFHPGTTNFSESEREAGFSRLCDTATTLAKNTDKAICIENMVRGNLLSRTAHLEELIENTEGVKIVLDLNHLLLDDQAETIKKLGKSIATLHVSDCDLIKEKHELPGLGKIDWNKVLSALESVGYEGVFNYEVLEKYSLDEIKENYENLLKAYAE
ncbi:MAG: sugar phosphate isomerase/epimerase [Clostridia bacterium]|nr:sugar phosphate isomerase/epimerase [Clostridia bacterium]